MDMRTTVVVLTLFLCAIPLIAAEDGDETPKDDSAALVTRSRDGDLKAAGKLLQSKDAKSIRVAVSAYLDAAEKAPKNGYNPQLEYPKTLPVLGSKELMREITSGTQRRRGCAASILSTHPDPGQVRTFWRGQLDSPDSQICWWAVCKPGERRGCARL